MGRRRDPRIDAVLPVQVWGTDVNGKPFVQSALALNVSAQGAVLEGIAIPLRPGEIIRIQCGTQKANFQVMWVGEPGTPRAHYLGIKSLVPERCIWSVRLPSAKVDSYPVPASQDRRVPGRQNKALKIELREDGSDVPLWGTTEDISLGGCYVKALSPPKNGAAFQVRLWLGSDKIWSRAKVRNTQPGAGFGIEFTYMPDADVRILKTYLDSIPARKRTVTP